MLRKRQPPPGHVFDVQLSDSLVPVVTKSPRKLDAEYDYGPNWKYAGGEPKQSLIYGLKMGGGVCRANIQSVASGRYVMRFGKANVNCSKREPMNYGFRLEKATTFLDLMPLSLLK